MYYCFLEEPNNYAKTRAQLKRYHQSSSAGHFIYTNWQMALSRVTYRSAPSINIYLYRFTWLLTISTISLKHVQKLLVQLVDIATPKRKVFKGTSDTSFSSKAVPELV